MFKKLKQKIEEGGGEDRPPAFSPRKLPGSVIRSVPPDSNHSSEYGAKGPALAERVDGHESAGSSVAPISPAGSSGGRWTEGVEVGMVDGEWDPPAAVRSNRLPSHLQSSVADSQSAEAILEARIKELQEEKLRLSEQLEEKEVAHSRERAAWEVDMAGRLAEKDQELEDMKGHAEELDGEVSEHKLQVVELQLEKEELEQQLAEQVKQLQEQVDSLESEKAEEKRRLEERISTLEQSLTEREGVLDQCQKHESELEDKVHSLESRVAAYAALSEDEAINRLQNEVVDLERRLQQRNIEIQMLETEMASQRKQKETAQQLVVDRYEDLEANCKKLSQQLSEAREENQDLGEELEEERACSARREREGAELRTQLEELTRSSQELVEQLKESHQAELEQVGQEKDMRILELLQSLDQLRVELAAAEAREAANKEAEPECKEVESTATQTEPTQSIDEPAADDKEEVEDTPAVLPVESQTDSMAAVELSVVEQSGESATLQSHELEEELQFLRREQLRFQEELTEKSKIIKLQQQKIVDMRKALNKELKSQTSADGTTNNTYRQKSKEPSSPLSRVAIASEVNFQYLKHVVIRFICSREDEASQLVRAIATLLEFTPEEEQHIKEYLEYRMSWFGTMPPPLYQPSTRRTST